MRTALRDTGHPGTRHLDIERLEECLSDKLVEHLIRTSLLALAVMSTHNEPRLLSQMGAGGLTDLSSLASMKRCHECESVSGPDAKYATGSLRYCAKRSGA